MDADDSQGGKARDAQIIREIRENSQPHGAEIPVPQCLVPTVEVGVRAGVSPACKEGEP